MSGKVHHGGKGGMMGDKSGGKVGPQEKLAQQTRSHKAGLQFPVGRIHRYLKARSVGALTSESTDRTAPTTRCVSAPRRPSTARPSSST